MTSFDPITAFMVVVGATSEHLPTGVATGVLAAVRAGSRFRDRPVSPKRD